MLKSLFNRNHVFLFGISIMLFGLLYSRAMISIGVMVIGLNGIIHPNYKLLIQKLFKQPLLQLWMLVWFIHLLSGFNSENTQIWLAKVMMKLPFLLLPFATLSIDHKKLKGHWLANILLCFTVLLCISTWPSCLELIYNFEEVLFKYSQGKVLPTPINHIRYSILIAFMCLVQFYYYSKSRQLINLILSAYLFVFIHLLAVRSGLFCLYGAMVFLLFWYSIEHKKWRLLLLGTFSLALIGTIVIKTVPTLNQKVNYMLWDIEQRNNKMHQANYSDSKRLISYELGFKVWKENFFWGTGIGDLKAQMQDKYLTDYPSFEVENMLMPHNQFMRYAAAFGVLGGLAFIFISIYPFFLRRVSYLIVLFNVIMILSFLIEGTLENQIGMNMFMVFNIMLYVMYRNKMNCES